MLGAVGMLVLPSAVEKPIAVQWRGREQEHQEDGPIARAVLLDQDETERGAGGPLR
jgi:hypothetical protein